MTTIIKHLRAQYYEAPMPVQGLVQYHRSKQQIAGLWGTETCHPPRFDFLAEDLPAVLPDQRIDPNWANFQAGRDPVMEWVLSLNSRRGGS